MRKMHGSRIAVRDCSKRSMLFRGLFQGVLVLAVLAMAAAHAPGAFAADFQIQPTSMFLSTSDKSGAFSVINSGNEKIDFQISVKEWAQDEKGKDVYTDTQDIVFFPKIMTVDPNSQRAIRVGIKGPKSLQEKTYRLFVEEIPTPKKESEMKQIGKIKAGITIAFRFAVPVFILPVKPQESAVIEKLDMVNGTARATVRNAGNVHVKLLSITFTGKAADGKELFTREVAGWYVLRGMAFPYEAKVSKEQCNNLATIDVTAKAEDLTINTGTMNVQKKMCAP
jgi:fimbrial chaperone protein